MSESHDSEQTCSGPALTGQATTLIQRYFNNDPKQSATEKYFDKPSIT